ncbi:hypothetical protein HK102_000068 [Quaeritorhiza haematococci]|nr:hypothetical protein HK102_000068 [Quaeritorhiza haematococci]
MPKYKVEWRADLENLTNLRPNPSTDYQWTFKVQCTSCREAHGTPVSFTSEEQHELSGSRGSANLVMKCSFCAKQGSMSIEQASIKPYTADDAPRFKSLVVLECRGLEPVEWIPGEDFEAEGVDSGTKFDEIDLSDDWAEYDEKAGQSVGISELESKISGHK